MLPFQFHLYNQLTVLSETYDDFLVVSNYGKLSAKFISGTLCVIEKVGLLPFFQFLARTAIRLKFYDVIFFLFFTFIYDCIFKANW